MIAVYKKFILMLGVTVLLCLSASIVWSETMDDLVKRNGVYYKKFSNKPSTPKQLEKRKTREQKIMKELYDSDFHEITWDKKCV